MKKLIFAIVLSVGTLLYAQEIQPSQVLIIGNSDNTASLNLARQYAQARNIPNRNILMLELPNSEQISREQYDRRLAGPIRMFLQQQKLQDKIKVLVTMYGVPLKVAGAEPTKQQLALAQQIKAKFYAQFAQMERDYRELEKLAGITTTQATQLPGHDKIDSFFTQLPALAGKVTGMYRSIATVAKQKKDTGDRQILENQFVRLRLEFEGQSAIAMAMQQSSDPNKAVFIQEFQAADKELYTLLGESPENRDLERCYALTRQMGGYFLTLKTLYEDYFRLIQKESMSSVDSELSLVLWTQYPLAGKVPNPLNPRFSNHPLVAGKEPVLMVSRLDGPEPEVVARIIHDSIKAEREGLTGKFYLDARGLKDKSGYIIYDDNLRSLAETVKTSGKIPVVLDDKPEVFSPKTCPDTALYCGWYSLRQYVPAFTFVPGAVGYHIASFEAVTLKQKQSNLWVKRMLENGIAATLGPVEEPLLDAFPMPTEFFGLLMTGKYTLVEVYYKTKRYNSWRMILIGDPLYRPFAKHPLMEESDVTLGPLNLILVH